MNLSVRRNRLSGPLLAVALVSLCALVASGWGYVAHRMIAEEAISILPDPPKGFFDANLSNIRAFANEPDAISMIDSSKGPDHFIDLDSYSKPPFDDVPSDEKEFVAKFGADALKEGRLPWAIRDEYNALVDAMAGRDYEGVVKHAGLLSHFVGDATMPLHATKNYKGQLTNNVIFDRPDDPNRHVHVRFEIGMVNANAADLTRRIRPRLGKPHKVDDPADEGLALAKVSFAYIAPILDADRELLKPGDEVTPVYFAGMYAKVGNIAAQQMALASTELASFWQSAWEKAGRPGLIAARVVLSKEPLTMDEAKRIRESQKPAEAAK